MKTSIVNRIEEALNTIRPYMEADGGNVKVLDYTHNHILKLEFLGHCSSCPMSSMTFKAGIRDAVMKAVPEIQDIEVINMVAL